MADYSRPILTNGEHDTLWKAAFQSHIPTIADSLRRANALTCAKELYELEIYTKSEYAYILNDIMKLSNFGNFSKDELNERLKKIGENEAE